MRCLKSLSIAIAVLAFAALARGGEGNGVGRGGGVGIWLDSVTGAKLVFLDLALSKSYELAADPIEANPALAQVRQSKAFQVAGVAIVRLEQFPAFQQVEQRIKEWEETSPGLMSFMRRAIDALPGYIVSDQALPLTDAEARYSLPQSLKRTARIQKIALFDSMAAFPVLHMESLDLLGTQSQMGLIVHEIYRHIQLGYQNQGFKDVNLQKLTAVFCLESPSKYGSLDKSRLLGRTLRKEAQREAELAPLRRRATGRVCELLRKSDLKQPGFQTPLGFQHIWSHYCERSRPMNFNALLTATIERSKGLKVVNLPIQPLDIELYKILMDLGLLSTKKAKGFIGEGTEKLDHVLDLRNEVVSIKQDSAKILLDKFEARDFSKTIRTDRDEFLEKLDEIQRDYYKRLAVHDVNFIRSMMELAPLDEDQINRRLDQLGH